LDELRVFDETYVSDTRSDILKSVAAELGTEEKNIVNVVAYKDETNEAAGFTFECDGVEYRYSYNDKILRRK
ncbi:MAG: hypothetical protein IKZ03_02570, partial [Clostridia bacterium]|nr:hypothetical protein [Clostridia bacterium]